jgi:dienelactone hydrolase
MLPTPATNTMNGLWYMMKIFKAPARQFDCTGMVELNDYAMMRARELAKLGYIAMAMDIYGNGK